MKRTTIVFALLLEFLLIITLTGCANSRIQVYDSLDESVDDYIKMVHGDIPKDLCLSIYYIRPYIATRRPISVEDLINFTDVNEIIVESEGLAAHSELLKKLDPSLLQPATGESYIDARMYYIFEVGDDKLLEIIIGNGGVFVNGFSVEFHPILCELIAPFLPEDAREDWISYTKYV